MAVLFKKTFHGCLVFNQGYYDFTVIGRGFPSGNNYISVKYARIDHTFTLHTQREQITTVAILGLKWNIFLNIFHCQNGLAGGSPFPKAAPLRSRCRANEWHG